MSAAVFVDRDGVINEPVWDPRTQSFESPYRPGEKVSVRIAPLRDGRPGGLFLDLTKADGTMLDSGLPKNGTPVNVPQL